MAVYKHIYLDVRQVTRSNLLALIYALMIVGGGRAYFGTLECSGPLLVNALGPWAALGTLSAAQVTTITY